jgi:hypothetical protein
VRLSSDLWVYALIRRVQLAGAVATVARKGDARAGAVLIKTFDGRSGRTRIYAEAVSGEGESVWMRPIAGETEAEADAYILRSARLDPDLWVVEIEHPDGARFLTERVQDG